ncbi:hypothetical protein LTR17_009836 [Elasticomyces elasticus]|nr:hypothetical protein LTR17_009836 [Elasticomyces elasticus]
MDSYIDYPGQTGFLEYGDETGDRSTYPSHYTDQTSTNDGQQGNYYNANGQTPMGCDIKPRLSKTQHEILESEYAKQTKPTTSTKKVFAEQLGVTLDKVNNWFQNRRAKAKQDQKKQNGVFNLYQAQQHQANHLNFPDLDSSPAYPAPDYFSTMQQFASDEHLPGNGFSEAQHYPAPRQYHGLPYQGVPSAIRQPHDFIMQPQMQPDMFDTPQELNRRTLTQEQFDAFAHSAGPMGAPDVFQNDFSGNHDVLNQVFPELQNDTKEQHVYAYPSVMPPPMSSHDSTLPSSASDQSMTTFPSTSSIRGTGTMSSASSEWADSRSSSVSEVYQEDPYAQVHAVRQPIATTSQWQPGQSVPVDVNALSEQFRQVAQARQSSPQYHAHEQPLAWPADNAYERRQSQTSSMLAHSMSSVELHTPQMQQHPTFKSPAPPSNIAARRQRPRPAALGITSMRSQSYNGAAQPGSPGQVPHCLSPGQSQVRRIRSSNVLGGVAQGRVHKPMPGAPQRSPLAWSFSDAVNSPKGMRTASAAGTLAPPTPCSPNEFLPQDHVRAHPGWQSSGHVSRQPSISETDYEPVVQYTQAPLIHPQTFVSPPHTPRYHQQGFVQQRVGNNVITENTPPQSAPASQQCFPSNALAHQYMQSQSQPQQYVPIQHLQQYVQPQPLYMNVSAPEQHFQPPSMTMLHQQQHSAPLTSPPNNLPPQYAHGIPMVNGQGELELVVPPQFMQQPVAQASTPPQQHTQQMPTPPKNDQFESMVGVFSTAPPPPVVQVTAQVPKQPPPQPQEFFVHEYTPPAEIKRAATPRRAVETVPKSYAFANHGPDDFKRGKKGRTAATTASNSPNSSS